MDNDKQTPGNSLSKANWQLCAICQEATSEALQCPADTKRSDVGAGYKTLAGNIEKFAKLGCMPKELCLSLLDEGNGIEETFLANKACWHRSCYALFNSTKLKRAEKRHATQEEDLVGGKFTRSNAGVCSENTIPVCFICDKSDDRSLHNVSTLGLDDRVRECATLLNHEKLLAKLSGGDLVALEAKYHTQCLSMLYRKAQYAKEEGEESEQPRHRLDGIALAELVSYIEELRTSGAELPIFKLADLAKMYKSCLQRLGCDTTARVNTSRLKERLVFQIPGLQAYNKGRDVYLAFGDDVGLALHKAREEDCDEEAMHLAKTAAIVRKDMLASKHSFSGSFESDCQAKSVPASLLSLVKMILYGPNIEEQACSSGKVQAALTISQLLQYNTHVRCRDKEVKQERRSKCRETPLPIYIGISVHAKTRSRDLVETLHELGISISYDRVLAISTDLGNEVCRRYIDEGAVCPSNLRLHLFTTAAVDNIDHNPTSTTAQDSFHGTGISLFQQPTPENPGTTRAHIDISHAAANTKSVRQLPEAYTELTPVIAPTKHPQVSATTINIQPEGSVFNRGFSDEVRWLENSSNVICNEESLKEGEIVSWGAFHSRDAQYSSSPIASAISALLPLFPDQAKSIAMIRHAMDIIKLSVNLLNPDQVPVIAFNQPLFAVAKEIQWNWSDSYGEDKFMIMFGGLHIEMAFLKVIGGWLEGSGWTTALADANVATPGTAESFIKAASITRSRRAHQVTACCLFILLQKAHTKYKEGVGNEDDMMSFDNWCNQQVSATPHFQYWHTALQLELLLLVFLKSLRAADFDLYIDALSKMLPWFFAMNHSNYARWLPVHLRDMRSLEQLVPHVASEFKKGLFTVKKTPKRFSSIAIDQAHEQNNAMVKGDGGAVGLTENPNALRRWMLSGPEMARLVNEFEAGMAPDTETKEDSKHHEEHRSFQASFHQDVKSLVAAVEDLGNPFLEESGDLFVLDTKVIAEEPAVSRMRQIESTGKRQCETFISERLVERKKPLTDPITRNKLSFFATSSQKSSKATQQLSSMKRDCSLFSRLYISCQTRNGDLDEFFKHENQGCPPSLSDQGNLRLPKKKSELTECLQALTVPQSQMPRNVNVVIIDGAAVVNMVTPKTERTFSGYAAGSFIPYITAQLCHVNRLDIVWDEYLENSLKATTRCKRGSGVRQCVAADNKLPRNWKEFLRVDQNKQELFKYLAECITSIDVEKQVISTYGKQVLSIIPIPCNTIGRLAPCSHEEADTRMLLHAADAVQCGYTKILLRTVDTDVLVLAVAFVEKLQELQGDERIELWVGFGTGIHLRYIAAHEIARKLNPQVSSALPFFHAFTGCDTVSCFYGKGKKTAMDTWKCFPAVTTTFLSLGSTPSEVNDTCMATLERFMVLLYDRTSAKTAVDDARKQLFVKKGRQFDNIPPTRAALLEHSKRAVLQAGYIWGQALTPSPTLPSPQDWGWTLDGGLWRPFWTTLPDVMGSCQELVRCGCKKGCRRQCSCIKASLRCTALCKCPDECNNR